MKVYRLDEATSEANSNVFHEAHLLLYSNLMNQKDIFDEILFYMFSEAFRSKLQSYLKRIKEVYEERARDDRFKAKKHIMKLKVSVTEGSYLNGWMKDEIEMLKMAL